MHDVTDAGVAWLTSALTVGAREAARWIAAPRERRELPTGTVFDAVGVDGRQACGLLDRFVEYGLHGVPIAVVDDVLYTLVRPGSVGHVRDLTVRDQNSQPIAVVLFGDGDRFIAPPLEVGVDDRAMWLVAPIGVPHLPLASLVLAALSSLSRSPSADDSVHNMLGRSDDSTY